MSEQDNKLIIVGVNSVMEALLANRDLEQLYIAEGTKHARITEILQLAKGRRIKTNNIARHRLDQLVGNDKHQGVAAVIAAYSYLPLDEMIERARGSRKYPLLVVLDGLEDPHNLGAILRTADVVAASGIIIPERRSVGLTATVAKTSAGAIEHVPVARVTNLVQTVERLKSEGYWIVGADASGSTLYTEIDYQMPVCLVIGGEGQGISKLLLSKCDYVAKLPMYGNVNSLNASVATSIFLYEILRQQDLAGKD